MQAVTLVAVFAFWSLVNLRGVTLGARLNAVATAAKLLPLLLVVIGGAFAVNGSEPPDATAPPAAPMSRACRCC